MTPRFKILIIDDEPQIRNQIRIALEAQNYIVIEAHGGAEGLRHANDYLPDAIILDLGLPDMSGAEVLKELRKWSLVPIIILSVQGEEADKVDALNVGADDYITKPFGMKELIARIRVTLRHKGEIENPNSKYRLGDFEIDVESHLIWLNGEELRLTSTEFDLLKLFVQNPNKVLTHQYILKQIWGPRHESDTHYLRIYIGALRKKIESNTSEPKYILTEPGVGYRFKVYT